MDFYPYYQEARNKSWQTLIECKINKLPVDLNDIAGFYCIEIALYSKSNMIQLFKHSTLYDDGFITKINGKKTIFLNDKVKTIGRRRFTVGHELSHAVLNHPMDIVISRNSEIDSKTDPIEAQANIFSRDILAPACVLYALNVTTVDEIMELCKLSRQSSQIRLDRLNELRKRNAFFKSPLERKVFKNFEDFIYDKRGKRFD